MFVTQDNQISWNLLTPFSWDNPPDISFGRTKEICEKYTKHTIDLKSRNIDINKYLADKYFTNDCYYSIDNNTFPYNLCENIEHWIIWINPKYQHMVKTKKNIGVIIANNFYYGDTSKLKNVVYFENLECRRSIKCLPHIQVFKLN